jgi:hypothetical protein
MILALLLMTAEPQTAIDAERAFVADAQKLGQWTAFRKYAANDALMFTPQPVNAQAFLNGRQDPPVSVFWWPGKSFVSCDGNTAINTGPWVRQWGKSVGYFTTIWQRQPDGSWKWIYDAGDELTAPRAEGGDIKPMKAPCPKFPLPPQPQREVPADVKWSSGSSKDGTLTWTWSVMPDGSRTFSASLWDGKTVNEIIADKVAAAQ